MSTQVCDYCKEEVKKGAMVCVHCWNETKKPFITPDILKNTIFAVILILFMLYMGNILKTEPKSFADPNIQTTK